MKTTCPYCGVGCGVVVEDNVVRGDAQHPANHGRLCIKGATLAETLDDSNRLLSPMVDGRETGWGEALGEAARRFAAVIAAHGPDAVAFYGSGQFLTEDYYVANKLMKGFIGSANIDTNSRLCMASTVAGHMRAFGEDIVPGCYEDIDEADLIVLVGANAAWCHPVLFERALAARAARGTRIVVVDPRRTASADLADLHLPLRPDADVALFLRLLVAVHERGCVDAIYVAARTEGFAQALAVAQAACITPDMLGLADADLALFLDWFCGTPRVVTLFSQGVNQSVSGTDKVNAIINVHLATGRIGRVGMGPFSLTGQPNAMGGREVGGFANQLAAHLRFTPDDHALLQGFWGAPKLAEKPGLKALDMFEAMLSGRIKAIWIAATNPAETLPRSDRVRAALAACDVVVVADCWPTETTRHADIVLPASGWGEKDGTVTNSARIISRQRAFRPAPGLARPDWWMITQFARHLGFRAAFEFAGPAAIFREHAALSGYGNHGARLFDISARQEISDAEYDALAPFTWGRTRFFGDAGHMVFVPVAAPPVRPRDRAFGFVLNTGRLRDQWHTMTRTGFVPQLLESGARADVSMNPADAAEAGITAGDLARITTRHGSIVLPAALESGQRRGEMFVAMHWTDEHSAGGSIGRLIGGARDRHSGQPALKSEPAGVERLSAAWVGVMQSRTKLRPVGRFYAGRVPLADGMHRIELAGWQALSFGPELSGWAAGLCAAGDEERVELIDAGRGVYRLGLVQDGRLSACIFLAPRADMLPDAAALAALFASASWVGDRGALLLARGGMAVAARGRMVCLCHRVSEAAIRAAITIQNVRDMDGLMIRLKAGTNCGSCKGELAAILQSETQPELVT
ncbi:MAG: molybdopterin-dependent oxidoreductase [Acidocella sp.]|nr:molybdopterin-dependent oxidoreductase [Acidocella sp.]